MKQALILKLKESVTDSSLRFINELRLPFAVNGDKSGYVTFGRISTSNVIKAKFEIISGTGYFTSGDGSTNLGQSAEVIANSDNYLRLYASTDVEVIIKNFDIMAIRLGLPPVAKFYNRSSTSNSPLLVLNTADLKYKTFITDFWTNLTGDVANLTKLTSLERFHVTGNITGNIAAFAEINTLNYFSATLTGLDASFASLALVKNANPGLAEAELSLRGTNFTGGDLYQYFLDSNDIFNENLSFSIATEKVITCSYVSGVSVIPELNLGLLSLVSSGTMFLSDVVAFLTMLKDGITSGDITLVSGTNNIYITVVSSALTDATVNGLVADLAGLGLTINRN